MTNDDRIGRHVVDALGEPPDAGPALQRLEAWLAAPPAEAASTVWGPRAIALVAAALAVAVIVTLTGTRLLTSRRSPSGTPAAAGALNCRLPVVVTGAGYPPTTREAGFVNVAAGAFQRDPAAPAEAVTYDGAVRGWVPVRPPAIAPNGSRYAYVRNGSASFELHVVDARTRSDRVVWTAPGGVGFPIEWAADGIHVTTTPAGGGPTQGWVVSPSGGQPKPGAMPRITAELGRTNIGTYFASMPYEETFQGMSIVRDSTRGVELVGSDGRTTLIHALTPDFDPATFVADGDRLWAVNADGSAIWLWTRSDGLRRLPVRVAPQSGVTYWAAGPCR
jgi:hypothetical protein